jgi:hypothetical protein
VADRAVVTAADALDAIDALCARLVDRLLEAPGESASLAREILQVHEIPPDVLATLAFITTRLLPDLDTSADAEIASILAALNFNNQFGDVPSAELVFWFCECRITFFSQ